MITTVLALAIPAALVGCAQSRPVDQPSKPPLAIASSGVPLPSASHPAGPPITAACPLLSAGTVASAFGASSATPTEDRPATGQGASTYICRYQFGSNWTQLIVTVGPVTGTPQQAVEHSLQRYTGTLEPVPGLGDAAQYNGSGTYANLDVARAEGTEMRQVSLINFVSGNPKDKVIALARAVLDRI